MQESAIAIGMKWHVESEDDKVTEVLYQKTHQWVSDEELFARLLFGGVTKQLLLEQDV